MPEEPRDQMFGTAQICPVCGNFRANCTCTKDFVDDATVIVRNEARQAGVYRPADEKAPHGYLLGRPIIGRDTEINGGVFAWNKEALVVDDKYPLVLECWQELMEILNEDIYNGKDHKENIFRLINNIVTSKMSYNLKAVEEIDNKIQNTKHDWYKVSLDVFMDAGVGVCRHQALLAGYLLEKLTKSYYQHPEDNRRHRYLRGEAHVERSINYQKLVGHAWAKYTTFSGETVIIDPANNFVASFDQLSEERLKKEKRGSWLWYYEGVSRDDPEEDNIFIC